MKKPTNFRDLGNLITTDGRKIKEKLILRSGELTGLSELEKKTLTEDYNLKTVVDFRTKEEIQKSPNDALEGVVTRHIDILDSTDGEAGSMQDLMSKSAEEAVDQMMNYIYRRMVGEERASKQYGAFVKVLLEQQEGAVLFHCFAGKDRTGLGAAIVLSILGVPKETIINDYLKTNELRREENEVLIEYARKAGQSERELEAMKIAMNVKEQYLQSAFDEAKKRYGSFDRYIEKGLGISAADAVVLKEKYLV